MKRQTTLGAIVMIATLLAACGASNPAAPPLPGGGAGYDGVWLTSFNQGSYPIQGMSFQVVNQEFVQANGDFFFDLLQCMRTFTNRRFEPQPLPIPINGNSFAVSGMTNGNITIVKLNVTFTSSTTATGTALVTFGSGATCVYPPAGQRNQLVAFTARRL